MSTENGGMSRTISVTALVGVYSVEDNGIYMYCGCDKCYEGQVEGAVKRMRARQAGKGSEGRLP